MNKIFDRDQGRRLEIKLAGVGGQGVVLAGTVLGRAAAIYDGLNAVMTKEYGSDMRGGDVCTDLVVSGGEIRYPAVLAPDVLVVLAQRALDVNKKWFEEEKDSASERLLICDTDLVSVEGMALPSSWKVLGLPFNTLADREFHSSDAANMIFLGFFAVSTGIVSIEALHKALQDLLPPNNLETNIRAVDFGIERTSSL